MQWHDLRRDIRNAGVRGACFDVAYRALNKTVPFMILKMMRLTMATANRRLLEPPLGFHAGFVDDEDLHRYAADPANDLNRDFVTQAIAKGDRCYALWEGDVLASYSWYSTGETHITDELVLRFEPGWVYMYKGYTLPRYRGLHLHGIAMVMALDAYVRAGARGIVGFVEANNFSSLKSGYRMGHVDAGRIVALKAFGRYWIHLDEGCRTYGFALTSLSPSPLPRVSGVKGLP